MRKTIKHAFSMFYTLIKHGFMTNQSARRILSIFKTSNKTRVARFLNGFKNIPQKACLLGV